MTNYGPNKEPESLSFIIPTVQGELPFRLPANVAKVEKILLDMRKTKPEPWHSNYDIVMTRLHDQAVKVAWRIIRDWVAAQTAIIETEMVTIQEVFLPYLLTPSNKTLYQAMSERGFYLSEGKGQSNNSPSPRG